MKQISRKAALVAISLLTAASIHAQYITEAPAGGFDFSGGKDSWGGDDKLNMTPLFNWGSGQFTAKAKAYDLSAITDDHILHIGFMNIGGEGYSAKYQLSLGPDDASTNGFMLEVNVAAGAMNGKFVGQTSPSLPVASMWMMHLVRNIRLVPLTPTRA